MRDGRGEEESQEGCGYSGRRGESTASPCLTALLFRLSAHKWDQESKKTGSIGQAWLKLSKVFKLVPAAQKQFLSLFSANQATDVLVWQRTSRAAVVIWA